MDQHVNSQEQDSPITIETKEMVVNGGLVYVTDVTPGITRKRAGKGFAYYLPDGKLLADRTERKRINALAIPPAYGKVWISPEPLGHLQATGRDDRGRKQYRYHADWQSLREQRKFAHLVAFAEALPGIREQIDHDLRRRGPTFEKAVATVVFLMDKLLIRVGNREYARTNESYGLTTLTEEHVDLEGNRLRFHFRGKSGREWSLHHTDRRIARVIRSLQELPGQHLFRYVDGEGVVHAVDSADVNAYIQELAGESFTSRQFRTWAATTECALQLAGETPASSKRDNARIVNATLDRVCKRLGNTRTVCRNSYVHPRVFESFEAGELAGHLAPETEDDAALDDRMTLGERRVLAWLKSATA
ncbi:DNA topoisomerase IB [Pararhizobium mangrovi]|uniref:DNA topoisomerase n=1 Tax=Pararhizobium mangrovi TaxID=2590452 RepID=A0A506TX89_9HYPH|nr:DNA topoisomerase IB [Pararhizobium mangrovi]TPW25926.1 DNA topoisomerase IB [Pararhizobium mangrovi]